MIYLIVFCTGMIAGTILSSMQADECRVVNEFDCPGCGYSAVMYADLSGGQRINLRCEVCGEKWSH
jgi:transcription elongation factor Elf1